MGPSGGQAKNSRAVKKCFAESVRQKRFCACCAQDAPSLTSRNSFETQKQATLVPPCTTLYGLTQTVKGWCMTVRRMFFKIVSLRFRLPSAFAAQRAPRRNAVYHAGVSRPAFKNLGARRRMPRPHCQGCRWLPYPGLSPREAIYCTLEPTLRA